MKLSENEKCPVCERAFSEDDDIVFCPVCGTPHHRACYKQTGKCANDDKHGSGFEYGVQSDENAKQHNQPDMNVAANAGQNGANICSSCGREIDNEALRCPYCGEKQGSADYEKGGANGFKPEGEAQKTSSEKTDGIDAYEAANVIGQNAQRFIKVFSKNKKISWNWSALIFGPYYLIFRKMYKEGIMAIAARMAATVAVQYFLADELQSFANYYSSLIQQIAGGKTVSEITAVKGILTSAPHLFAILFAIDIIINIVIALFADYFYKAKVIGILKRVDETLENGGLFNQTMPFGIEQNTLSQKEMKKLYLSRLGGRSFFAAAAAYLAVLYIISTFL